MCIRDRNYTLGEGREWERVKPVLKLARDKSEKNVYRVLDEETMRRVISCIQKIQDKRLQNLTEKDVYKRQDETRSGKSGIKKPDLQAGEMCIRDS